MYYNLGYQMWQRDNPSANIVTSPKAPVQKMQRMAMSWGFGQPTGDRTCRTRSTAPCRPANGSYYYWKDNAYACQDWCKYGKANGTYVEQIEYQDCRSGNVWEPGQVRDRRDRPGL